MSSMFEVFIVGDLLFLAELVSELRLELELCFVSVLVKYLESFWVSEITIAYWMPTHRHLSKI